MKQALARIYLTLCSVFFSICLLGQDVDDADLNGSRRGSNSGVEDMEGMVDYQPIRFGVDEVVMVVVLLVACYVFGKIWKGCSYLLLILAALFYYLIRY